MKREKKKIKTMRELEELLKDNLLHNIPLAKFFEEYQLYPKQINFCYQFIKDFQSKSECFNWVYEDGETLVDGEEYLFVPHILKEENPVSKSELIALFRKIEEIDKKLDDDSSIELEVEKDIELNAYFQEIENMDKEDLRIALEIKRRKHNLILGTRLLDELELDEFIKRNYNLTEEKYYRICALLNNYQKLMEQIKARKRFLRSQKENIDFDLLEYNKSFIQDELVKHNAKLVNWILRHFFRYVPAEMEELQACGFEGLAIAINTFDYKREHCFSTYATPVIIRTIQKHFYRLTGYTWRVYLKIREYENYEALYKALTGDQEVTFDKIYNTGITGYSYEDYLYLQELKLNKSVPFTYVYPKDPLDERPKRHDMLISFEDYEDYDAYEDTSYEKDYQNLSEGIEKNELQSVLQSFVQELRPKEQEFVNLYFGLEDGFEKSYREIGKIKCCSMARVGQICNKGIIKLRHPSRAGKLLEYVDFTKIPCAARKTQKTISELFTIMLNYELQNKEDIKDISINQIRSLANTYLYSDIFIIDMKQKYKAVLKELHHYNPKGNLMEIIYFIENKFGIKLTLDFVRLYYEKQSEYASALEEIQEKKVLKVNTI